MASVETHQRVTDGIEPRSNIEEAEIEFVFVDSAFGQARTSRHSSLNWQSSQM
jgi:hypothetical protein